MSGILNITKHLRQQGLDANTHYEGVVVDNLDPRKLCRVRVRIAKIFDGISDDCLPWCVPMFGHADGSYIEDWDGGSVSMSAQEPQTDHPKPTKRSGVQFVPKLKSKVMVRFLNGDAHFPVYTGYALDDRVSLASELSGDGSDGDRYPDRAVIRMRNGVYIMIDSRSNEMFVNTPGDLYLTVLGDVHETVVGNKTTKVTSKLTDMPDYVKNAPASALDQMKQHQNMKVPWEGASAYKVGGGSRHSYIEGDETIEIKGDRIVKIWGNNTEEILGNERIVIRGTQTIIAQTIYHQEI